MALRLNVLSFLRKTGRHGVCVFLASATALSGSGIPPAKANEGPKNLSFTAPLSLSDVAAVQLPRELGDIQEVYQGKPGPAVVLVQDAHVVSDAQKSIEGIIEYFQIHYGMTLQGVEGGSGVLNPLLAQSYPDPEYLGKTLDGYLQKGELSGIVSAALKAGREGKLLALENPALYEKTIMAYLEAMNAKEENLKKLSRLENALNLVKEQKYPARLLDLDLAERTFWSTGHQDFPVYLEKLAAAIPPAAGLYPHLSALWEEIQNARKQDSSALRSDLEKLIRFIQAQALTQDELKSVNEKIQAFQTSQIDLRSAAGFLLTLASQKGFSTQPFDALVQACRNNQILAAMQGPVVFQELGKYSREVKKGLAGEAEISALDDMTERLRILQRLVRLQLSSREWRDYRINKEVYLGGFQDILRGETAAEMMGLEQLSLTAAESFYKAAEERDQIFTEKIFSAMKHAEMDRFLFLAGGFHAEGLTELLKAAGCSYVLVVPRISQIPEDASYDRAMHGDVSWKGYFREEGGQVDLEAAFYRGLVRRLIKKEWGDEEGRWIKLWRDELIRRLAAAGKTDQAERYTKYLDEISAVPGGDLETGRTERLLEAFRTLVFENRMTPENALRAAGAASAMPYTNINIGSISAAVMQASGLVLQNQSDASETDRRSELRTVDSTSTQYPDHPFLRQIGQSRAWQSRMKFLTSILAWVNPEGRALTAWYPHSGGDVLHALLTSNAETLIMSDSLPFGEEQHPDVARRFRLDILSVYYVTHGEKTIEEYVSSGGDLRDLVFASLRALGVDSEKVKVENLGGDRWRLSFDWRHPGEAKVRPRVLYFLGSETTESIAENFSALPSPLRESLVQSGGLDLLIEKGPNYYKEIMSRLEEEGADIGGQGRSELALAKVRIDAVNRLKAGLLKPGGKILGDHEQPDDWPSSNLVLLRENAGFERNRKSLGMWAGSFFNAWGNGYLELASRKGGMPDLLKELSQGRSELRTSEASLGAFTGITDRMPIVDFLQAFGIDLGTAVIAPVQGKSGFGRVPVSISQDTLESAASVFLSEGVYVEARAYVQAVKEKKLETLKSLYLLTYQGRPAALVWALNVPSGGSSSSGAAKTLVYPLLVHPQQALFIKDPLDKSFPPFPDLKLANSFYESVLAPYLSSAHGTTGYRFNLNILEDPYHESPQSAMQVRRYGNVQQGFAFPGSYGPWEHSTEYTLAMIHGHLLRKLNKDNLKGLTLVDVGSGAGRISEELARLGASVEAYDLTLLKAMNTQAWARVNGLVAQVHAQRARSVRELPPGDGYVVNFPNLSEEAPRFSEGDVIEYRDSRGLNVGIHPEDFRKVLEDLRSQAKPNAFLLIRGNFQGPSYETFREIMISTGWTDGLDEPLAAPEGVEPFGAAYFLRQGNMRSELRKDEEESERDRDLREKYERIIRQAAYGRHLEIEINQLLDALERPAEDRDLRWNEVPGPLIDRLVVGLQSANPHYSILSPGTLHEGDHVFVFEVPGVGLHGLGQKELNALLGEEMVNKLAALKREVIAEQIREMTGYEKLYEPLYSTYKEDVFAIRGFRDTREFPNFVKRWGGPDGMLRFGDELQARVASEVTAALREPTGPFRALLEKVSSQEYLRKKGITDLDQQPLFEVGYGVSMVRGKTASARLNADINAHQALTLSNLSGDRENRLFSNTRYRQQIIRVADLRDNQLAGQAPQGVGIFDGVKGARTLKLPVSEVLRKRFPWTSLSVQQRALFGNDAGYYGKAQQYFDFLRLQDYIKKWNVNFDRAVGEAIRIRTTMRMLLKLRDMIDSNRLVSDRIVQSLQLLPQLLLNDPRMLSISSARWFHTVVSEMDNPVYINFDVKGMGLMNVHAFELEIQAIEKELIEHHRVTSEVERIWRSSADDVTEKVQGIEPIIRRVLRRAYQEAGLELRDIPLMMGGDEVVFALDGSVMKGDRLDRFLFDVREEIQKTLKIDIRAGVSTRIGEYRRHFRDHPRGDEVAHASLMIGIDSITAVLKNLEALEAKGALDSGQRGAILFNETREGSEAWTGKVRTESGAIESFDAGQVTGIKPARSELRADAAVRDLDIYEYYQEIVSELGLNAAEQAEIAGILSDQYEHAFGFRSPQSLMNLVELLFSPRTDARLLTAVQEFAAVPGLDDSLNVGDLFDDNQIGHLLGYYFLNRIEEGTYEAGGPYKVLNLALKTRVSTGGASPDGLVRNLRTRMNLLAEFKSVTSRERPQLSKWLKGYEAQMKKYIRTVLTAEGPELYPPFLFHEAPSGVLWGVGNKLVQGADGEVDEAVRVDVNRRIQEWFQARVKEVREDLKKRKVPVSERFLSEEPVLEVLFFDQPELVRETPVQPNPQAMDAIRWERVYARILELREKYKYELVGVPRADVYKYFKIIDPVFYDEIEKDKENGQFRLYERYRSLGSSFRERERVIWNTLHPDRVPPSAVKGGGVSARERSKVITQASAGAPLFEAELDKGMTGVPGVTSGIISLGGLESRSSALVRDHLQRFLFSFRAYFETLYPEGLELPGNFTAALGQALQTAIRRGNQEDYLQPVYLSWTMGKEGVQFQVFDTARNVRGSNPADRNPHRLFSFEEAGIPYESSYLLTDTSRIAANRISFLLPWAKASVQPRSAVSSYDVPDTSETLPSAGKVIFQNNPLEPEQPAMVFFPAEEGQQRYLELDLVNRTLNGFLLKSGPDGQITERKEYTHYEAVDPAYYAQVTKVLLGISVLERRQSQEDGAVDPRLLAVKWMIGRVFRQTEAPDVVEIQQRGSSSKIQVQFLQQPGVMEGEAQLKILFPYVADRRNWSGPLYVVTIPVSAGEKITFNVYLRRYNESGDLVESEPLQPEPGILPKPQDAYEFEDEVTGDTFKVSLFELRGAFENWRSNLPGEEKRALLDSSSRRFGEIFRKPDARSELRLADAEAARSESLAVEMVAAVRSHQPLDALVLELAGLLADAKSRDAVWSAFEAGWTNAVSGTGGSYDRESLHSFAVSGRLMNVLRHLAAQKTQDPAALAELPELPVAFAVGEKLIYQASLGAGKESSGDVKNVVRTSLENDGRLILAAQAASVSAAAASHALDRALQELSGEIRKDRVARLQTGERANLSQFEDKLGKDFDKNRFVVFVEQGDSAVEITQADQKSRGLVFVLDPEVLSLLSVSEVMRILKNLALVPERLREVYRDELGLRPDPQTGLTFIGRNFLDHLARLAEAETQILASA